MNIVTIVVVMVLLTVVWSLHSMDLEYYTHASSYNEAFDNNLKIAFFSIFLIISLLLFSETSDFYTKKKNN